MPESDSPRRETRAVEIGLRVSMTLAGLAAAGILLLFVVLDPAQEPEPVVPIAYDEPEERIETLPVEARLFSDVTAVQPGVPFRVGVMLTLQPGWFVLWKDPGDAGLPTTIDIQAPAGFSVEPLRWPTPTQFLQPGQLIGYGYGEQVLLTATITAPDELGTARQIPVRAHVTWLTCERVCVPGSVDLETNVPVSDVTSADNVDLFTTWARRLPTQAAVHDGVTVGTTWRRAADDGVRHTVALDWAFQPVDVQWFPVQDASVRLLESVTRVSERHTEVDFVTQPAAASDSLPATLEAVVAYTDTSGVRRGVEVDVPLDAYASPGRR